MSEVWHHLMAQHVPSISMWWRTSFMWFGIFYTIAALFVYGSRLLRARHQLVQGDDSRPVTDSITAFTMGIIMLLLGVIPLTYHAIEHGIIP